MGVGGVKYCLWSYRTSQFPFKPMANVMQDLCGNEMGNKSGIKQDLNNSYSSYGLVII